jgi:hypothetical protein
MPPSQSCECRITSSVVINMASVAPMSQPDGDPRSRYRSQACEVVAAVTR